MTKRYQYGICGAFDFEEHATGGQSVKTREFYYALCNQVGKNNISILESSSYKKNPVSFLFRFALLMSQCETTVLFPAQKGVKVFAPLCYLLKKICYTKTYYNVIGGWIAQMVDENPILKLFLADFDCILVETNCMKNELEKRGITNVRRLRNFKRLTPIEESKIKDVDFPIRLCYFSRVTKMKGIDDAVKAVKKINQDKVQCTLDIYGPITDGYEEEFKILEKGFGKEITYKGKINPSNSVDVISKYDIQLFPTHYKTEGIPGAVIDSYFAGVPIVAARWNSFEDVILEGITGVGYEIDNSDSLFRALYNLVNDKERIEQMKHGALHEASKYMEGSVIKEFITMAKE